MAKETEIKQAGPAAKPDYLYVPEKCPCPRGPEVNCPRYRSCDACIEYHRSNPNTPNTACERLAESEGYTI